jgi:hypothetical protein
MNRNSCLVSNVLKLAIKSIRGLETDKEIVDKLLGEVRKGLDKFEASTYK